MRTIQVMGTQYQEVWVNPLDVVRQLFKNKTGGTDYFEVILDKDSDGYYYEYEPYKYMKEKEYIDEETYNYLTGLSVVINQLEKERLK